MPAPPARTELSDAYPNPSNAVFRAGIGKLLDYSTDLLGGTGNPPEALDALSIASVQSANLWVNSDGGLNQRAAGSTADGAYGFDRIVNLCDGGSVTLSQLAQPTDGIPYALRQLQPDASPKRMGSLQIVEARNCFAYRGKNLVFAPKFRCSAAVTIRVALVAWTGTADLPTRDVVNSWSSTTYTAGNFFVTNTTPIAVGSAVLTPATWADVAVSSSSAGGVAAPAAMNNLYLVYWTDTAVAQNVTLDTSVIRAGRGTVLPNWTPPDAQAELARCQRYFEVGSARIDGYQSAAGQIIVPVPFKATKRVNPTLTYASVFVTNTATFDALVNDTNSLNWRCVATATGGVVWSGTWTASSEL